MYGISPLMVRQRISDKNSRLLSGFWKSFGFGSEELEEIRVEIWNCRSLDYKILYCIATNTPSI
jgi:hypothetical protein